MINSAKGVVHGNTIECDQPIGLPDGQEVFVTIQPKEHALSGQGSLPGEGLARAAGEWDDDPEGLDAFVQWNRAQRKLDRQPLKQ